MPTYDRIEVDGVIWFNEWNADIRGCEALVYGSKKSWGFAVTHRDDDGDKRVIGFNDGVGFPSREAAMRAAITAVEEWEAGAEAGA